ncbi:MAG: hypothetical protein ACPHID_04390 [Thermoplasmatota archaeon]
MTAPAEEDYVQHFQALARVNLEIREYGPTATRLLCKSILESDIGNYSAALDDARDALDLKPELSEAHYQEAMALMLLAFTRVGVLAGSPGMAMPLARARRLLEQAATSFGAAAELNDEDEEAQADADAILGFLAQNEDDDDLEAALHAMFA